MWSEFGTGLALFTAAHAQSIICLSAITFTEYSTIYVANSTSFDTNTNNDLFSSRSTTTSTISLASVTSISSSTTLSGSTGSSSGTQGTAGRSTSTNDQSTQSNSETSQTPVSSSGSITTTISSESPTSTHFGFEDVPASELYPVENAVSPDGWSLGGGVYFYDNSNGGELTTPFGDRFILAAAAPGEYVYFQKSITDGRKRRNRRDASESSPHLSYAYKVLRQESPSPDCVVYVSFAGKVLDRLALLENDGGTHTWSIRNITYGLFGSTGDLRFTLDCVEASADNANSDLARVAFDEIVFSRIAANTSTSQSTTSSETIPPTIPTDWTSPSSSTSTSPTTSTTTFSQDKTSTPSQTAASTGGRSSDTRESTTYSPVASTSTTSASATITTRTTSSSIDTTSTTSTDSSALSTASTESAITSTTTLSTTTLDTTTSSTTTLTTTSSTVTTTISTSSAETSTLTTTEITTTLLTTSSEETTSTTSTSQETTSTTTSGEATTTTTSEETTTATTTEETTTTTTSEEATTTTTTEDTTTTTTSDETTTTTTTQTTTTTIAIDPVCATATGYVSNGGFESDNHIVPWVGSSYTTPIDGQSPCPDWSILLQPYDIENSVFISQALSGIPTETDLKLSYAYRALPFIFIFQTCNLDVYYAGIPLDQININQNQENWVWKRQSKTFQTTQSAGDLKFTLDCLGGGGTAILVDDVALELVNVG